MGQEGGPVKTTSAERRQSGGAPATPVLPTTPDVHALSEPAHEISPEIDPKVAVEAATIRIRLKSTGFTDEDIASIAELLLKKDEPKY